MSKKITVHSDGWGGSGTIILDEDGAKLEFITEATIEIRANEPTSISLTMMSAIVNATGTGRDHWLQCPMCGGIEAHNCDGTTLGGQVALCNNRLVMRDPWVETFCIRHGNHDNAHFDGVRVW